MQIDQTFISPQHNLRLLFLTLLARSVLKIPLEDCHDYFENQIKSYSRIHLETMLQKRPASGSKGWISFKWIRQKEFQEEALSGLLALEDMLSDGRIKLTQVKIDFLLQNIEVHYEVLPIKE